MIPVLALGLIGFLFGLLLWSIADDFNNPHH